MKIDNDSFRQPEPVETKRVRKPRSYDNSLANAFQNWTFDNVGNLIDEYADGFTEDLDDMGTEKRARSPEEIHKLIRAAHIDCNVMRRFLRLAELCVSQIEAGTMTREKAQELSGVDDFNPRFPAEPEEPDE